MSKRHYVIVLVMLLSCLMIFGTLAKKKQSEKRIRFPVYCKQMGYKFDLYNVVFSPSTKQYSQTIYFIHNISKREVRLLQSRDGNDPFIMHINGQVAPNRWSVFAVSGGQVKYICTNYSKRTKKHRVVNCQEVLDICEFPRARFGTNHRGTYWLTFNQSRKSAVNVARYHGVLLSDPKQSLDH